MVGKGDSDQDNISLIDLKASEEIKVLEFRGSLTSTTTSGSKKSVKFTASATTAISATGSKGWEDHFKVIDGKRVSSLTNASYSVAATFKTNAHIGLLGCIVVVIGCVLGAGIFAAPQDILIITQNPSLALLIWFIYGIIALVAALCYVELGTTFPVSGGDYAYLNECFGSLVAFLFQWSSNMIGIPAIVAIMATIVAKNLINPYTGGLPPRGSKEQWATSLLAMAILLFFCYLNCFSAKLTEKVQGSLMIVNISAIFLVISCGIASMIINGFKEKEKFKFDLPHPNSSDKETNLVKFQTLQFVRALFLASFSYFGYTRLGYITEEVENPMRNLPLAVIISLPIIIALNLFVNFCYFATLTNQQIYDTQTIASAMFRAVLPVEHVEKVVWIAPTLVAIAVLGSLSAAILVSSRVSFAGARNGHFPGIFSMTHKDKSTPIVSIAWIGLAGCLFILIGNVSILISIATYLETIYNCTGIYGLIIMRIKRKDLYRPIKLPLILPIAYSLIATFLFVVPIVTLDERSYKDTLPSVGGACLVIMTGIPVYFIFVRKGHKKFEIMYKIHAMIMITLQKLWMVIPEHILDDEVSNKIFENEDDIFGFKEE